MKRSLRELRRLNPIEVDTEAASAGARRPRHSQRRPSANTSECLCPLTIQKFAERCRQARCNEAKQRAQPTTTSCVYHDLPKSRLFLAWSARKWLRPSPGSYRRSPARPAPHGPITKTLWWHRRRCRAGPSGRFGQTPRRFTDAKRVEFEARGYNFVTGGISALRRRNSAYTVAYSPKTSAVRQNRRNDTRKLL
jgi:hypothetical protein